MKSVLVLSILAAVAGLNAPQSQRRAFLQRAIVPILLTPQLGQAEAGADTAESLYTIGTDTSSELKSRSLSDEYSTYIIPMKWDSSQDGSYLDTSYPNKPSCCTSLSVMKLSTDVEPKDLGGDVQKICSAFNIPPTTPEGTLTDKQNKWRGIDLIAGAKRTKGDKVRMGRWRTLWTSKGSSYDIFGPNFTAIAPIQQSSPTNVTPPTIRFARRS
jgi:hypothetical protein